jgi:uncharacterized membrane protein
MANLILEFEEGSVSSDFEGATAGNEVTVLDGVLDSTHSVAHGILDLSDCVHVGTCSQSKSRRWSVAERARGVGSSWWYP